MSERRPRLAPLVMVDSADSLKAPTFDFMLLVVSAIAAALASIEPTTNPASVADAALDPAVVFAVSLYLAMRASSGLASLASSGLLQLYLSYPLGRLGVALALYLSRILLPVLVLVGAPLIVAAAIVPHIIAGAPLAYLEAYGAYVVYLTFLGTLFGLVGVATRNSGTSAVAGLAIYFLYEGVYLLLNVMATARGSYTLYKMAMAMTFYSVVSLKLSSPGVPVSTWQFLLVPSLLVALFIVYLAYMRWRFEPP